MATYSLSFTSVSVPAGAGEATVWVEEDSNSDGDVDASDEITLVDGTVDYTTADVFAKTGQVRLRFEFGDPSDIEAAATVTAPIEVT